MKSQALLYGMYRLVLDGGGFMAGLMAPPSAHKGELLAMDCGRDTTNECFREVYPEYTRSVHVCRAQRLCSQTLSTHIGS